MTGGLRFCNTGKPCVITFEAVMLGLKSRGFTTDILNVVMELGNPEALEKAVKRRVRIAFVSTRVAVLSLVMTGIKKVVLEGVDLHRVVYIARHIRPALTRARNLFWEFAQSQRTHMNSEVWDCLVNFAANV